MDPLYVYIMIYRGDRRRNTCRVYYIHSIHTPCHAHIPACYPQFRAIAGQQAYECARSYFIGNRGHDLNGSTCREIKENGYAAGGTSFCKIIEIVQLKSARNGTREIIQWSSRESILFLKRRIAFSSLREEEKCPEEYLIFHCTASRVVAYRVTNL